MCDFGVIVSGLDWFWSVLSVFELITWICPIFVKMSECHLSVIDKGWQWFESRIVKTRSLTKVESLRKTDSDSLSISFLLKVVNFPWSISSPTRSTIPDGKRDKRQRQNKGLRGAFPWASPHQPRCWRSRSLYLHITACVRQAKKPSVTVVYNRRRDAEPANLLTRPHSSRKERVSWRAYKLSSDDSQSLTFESLIKRVCQIYTKNVQSTPYVGGVDVSMSLSIRLLKSACFEFFVSRSATVYFLLIFVGAISSFCHISLAFISLRSMCLFCDERRTLVAMTSAALLSINIGVGSVCSKPRSRIKCRR